MDRPWNFLRAAVVTSTLLFAVCVELGGNRRGASSPPRSVALYRPAVASFRIPPARAPALKRSASAASDPQAPVPAGLADRDASPPMLEVAPFFPSLKESLNRVATQSLDPIRKSLALTYLGYLGVQDHRRRLLAEASLVSPVDALPLLDTLVNGYGDHSRLKTLHRVADDKAIDSFHRLWAHELLIHAGDRSRLSGLYALTRSSTTGSAERLRGWSILADLGDVTLRNQARAMATDQDQFRATRLQGLALVARMDHMHALVAPPRRGVRRRTPSSDAAAGEVRRALDDRRLPLAERLSLAHSLSAIRDDRVVPFLYRVVERERSSVFDQVRALNTLALLGRRTHVRTLRKMVRTRPRARHAAARILVLMGDRSQTSAMLDACREGNLDAARALVLSRVLDQLGVRAPELRRRLRYRMLMDS